MNTYYPKLYMTSTEKKYCFIFGVIPSFGFFEEISSRLIGAMRLIGNALNEESLDALSVYIADQLSDFEIQERLSWGELFLYLMAKLTSWR